MICSVCGSEIKEGDKFCMACGTAVESMAQAAPAPSPVPEITPVPEVTASPAPEAAPEAAPAAQGAYFNDVANAPAQPAVEQPVYAQPQVAYAQPQQAAYAQPQQAAFAQPQTSYAQPGQPVILPPEASSLATTSLVLGIVALALSCTFYFSIGGIICGAIGIAKSGQFISKFGNVSGKVKAGRGLSIGGLVLGIVWSVIIFFIIVAAVASEF